MKIQNTSVCFWSWNSDISLEEIEKQMYEFSQDKIHGVVIHARAGLKIPYMGQQWFDAFRYAVQLAKEYGLEVIIYDEDGWPSGFAGGKVPANGEAYWHKCLFYDFASNIDEASIESAQIVAVYEPKENGKYRLKTDKTVQTEDLVFWYVADKHYVDLMYPEGVRSFIESTHEVYKQELGEYFGTVIKGFFMDEPQMNREGYPWSVVLEQEYFNRTGKRLLDELWLAAVEAEGYQEFRYELWDTICNQYFVSFLQPYAKWCADNNLYLTGHFPEEDGLCTQINSCGDIMRNYSAMQLPGMDHLGSRVASPVLMKQVSSAARQFAGGTVLSETFGCSGWGVDFRQLAWIWGGQSVLGVTKPCYHLSAFSIEGRRKRDYPAFFSYQEPWWDEFGHFDKWIKNLTELMTEGEREIHTLVISPVTSIMSEYSDNFHNQDTICYVSSQFRILLENLLDVQMDFDVSNESMICQEAVIEDGCIVIGKCRYHTIFFAESTVITEQLVNILHDFQAAGGMIICVGKKPKHVLGIGNIHISCFDTVICNRRDTMEKYIENRYDNRRIIACRPYDLKPVTGVRTHIRSIEGGMRIHIWPSENFASQKIILKANFQADAYVWDLNEGTKEKVFALQNDTSSLVEIDVNYKKNVVIDFMSPDGLSPERYTKLGQYQIFNPAIEVQSDNCITLDYAQLSIDGIHFSEREPVIRILDKLYEPGRTEELQAVIRYSFFCAEDFRWKEMKLAFEDLHYEKVLVNGQCLQGERENWWIDRCIGVYSLKDLVKQGENIIDIFYRVPVVRTDFAIEEVYETEKNRFFYPVEPESIYILGAFDVKTSGKIKNKYFALQTENHSFEIGNVKHKTMGDLTSQGLWFYRGNVTYSFQVKKEDAADKTYVIAERYNGTQVKLFVNGEALFSQDYPARFDIGNYLKQGDNNVSVELVGHNRNLMGPHHHVNGENFLIGPTTFAGEWAPLAEFMSPHLYKKSTWTEEYGFIPFGVKCIEVEMLRKTGGEHSC